jgi:hypothetical protein
LGLRADLDGGLLDGFLLLPRHLLSFSIFSFVVSLRPRSIGFFVLGLILVRFLLGLLESCSDLVLLWLVVVKIFWNVRLSFHLRGSDDRGPGGRLGIGRDRIVDVRGEEGRHGGVVGVEGSGGSLSRSLEHLTNAGEPRRRGFGGGGLEELPHSCESRRCGGRAGRFAEHFLEASETRCSGVSGGGRVEMLDTGHVGSGRLNGSGRGGESSDGRVHLLESGRGRPGRLSRS